MEDVWKLQGEPASWMFNAKRYSYSIVDCWNITYKQHRRDDVMQSTTVTASISTAKIYV